MVGQDMGMGGTLYDREAMMKGYMGMGGDPDDGANPNFADKQLLRFGRLCAQIVFMTKPIT